MGAESECDRAAPLPSPPAVARPRRDAAVPVSLWLGRCGDGSGLRR